MTLPQPDLPGDKLPRTPSLKLDDRRAVVTGAGRGIGLGLAAGLAEAGAAMTLCARTADEIEAGAEAIRAAGGQAEAAVLDVAHLGAVTVVVDGPLGRVQINPL